MEFQAIQKERRLTRKSEVCKGDLRPRRRSMELESEFSSSWGEMMQPKKGLPLPSK